MKKLRPGRARRRRRLRRAGRAARQVNELGINMLGVPEELGGAVSESSAVTSVLVTEALSPRRHGPRLRRARARRGRHRARRSGATPSSRPPTCPRSSATTFPRPPSPCSSRAPLFDPFAPATTARATGDGYELNGAQVAGPPGRRSRAVHRRRQARRRRVRPVLDRGQDRRASRSPPSPRWACAPPPPRSSRSRASSSPPAARIGDAGVLRRVRPPLAPRLVRARGRHRAGGARLPDPLRQRAHRFRRADLAPPGRRLHGLRHRDRVRRHAPGHLPRRQPRRPWASDFAREVAIARRLCANKGMKIGSDGVQLLGGHGYIKEHPVERWYRDLRAAGLMEGGLLV